MVFVARIQPGQPPMAEIVADRGTLGGQSVVSGTRVPARVILSYLRAGHSAEEIRNDYPSLPVGGIEAVTQWAEETLGPDWKTAELPPQI